MSNIRDLGFSNLRGVPTDEDEILRAAQLIGYVWETNYGNTFDVVAVEDVEAEALIVVPGLSVRAAALLGFACIPGCVGVAVEVKFLSLCDVTSFVSEVVLLSALGLLPFRASAVEDAAVAVVVPVLLPLSVPLLFDVILDLALSDALESPSTLAVGGAAVVVTSTPDLHSVAAANSWHILSFTYSSMNAIAMRDSASSLDTSFWILDNSSESFLKIAPRRDSPGVVSGTTVVAVAVAVAVARVLSVIPSRRSASRQAWIC